MIHFEEKIMNRFYFVLHTIILEKSSRGSSERYELVDTKWSGIQCRMLWSCNSFQTSFIRKCHMLFHVGDVSDFKYLCGTWRHSGLVLNGFKLVVHNLELPLRSYCNKPYSSFLQESLLEHSPLLSFLPSLPLFLPLIGIFIHLWSDGSKSVLFPAAPVWMLWWDQPVP